MKRIACILMAIMVCMQFFAIGASGESATDINLVPNGDFSNGLEGWSLRAPATEGGVITLSETGGVDGSACIFVNKSQGAGDILPDFSFEGGKAGDVYYLSAKIKLETAGSTATSKWVRIANKASSFIDTTGVTVSGDNWTTVSVKYKLTTDNDSNGVTGYSGIPFLRVSHGGTNYADGYYMDDVIIRKVDISNLVENGDFSGGLNGWKLRAPATEGGEVTLSQTGGVDGSPCAYVNTAQGSGDLLSSFSFEGAKAGDMFYIEAKIKLAEANATATSKWARVAKNTGSFIDTTGVSVSGDGWTTVGVVYTLTTDNDSNGQTGYSGIPYLRVSHGGSGYNGGYYIDDMVVVGKDAVMIDAIKVNGVTIDGFKIDKTEYVCKVPYGTTEVPTVTAVVGEYANNFKTTYIVENAEDLDGVTTLTVTSPDGTKSKVYEISFEMMERLTIGDVEFSGSFATNSTMTAKLPIKNNSLTEIQGLELDITLVVGLYDANGSLVNVEFASAKATPDFSILPGQTENLTTAIAITDTNCTLSAHLIDNFVSGNPLSGMQNY